MQNFNDQIIVILTESGLEKLKNKEFFSYDRIYEGKNNNKFLKIQLWEFANLFGEYLYMGNDDLPIKMEFELL